MGPVHALEWIGVIAVAGSVVIVLLALLVAAVNAVNAAKDSDKPDG